MIFLIISFIKASSSNINNISKSNLRQTEFSNAINQENLEYNNKNIMPTLKFLLSARETQEECTEKILKQCTQIKKQKEKIKCFNDICSSKSCKLNEAENNIVTKICNNSNSIFKISQSWTDQQQKLINKTIIKIEAISKIEEIKPALKYSMILTGRKLCSIIIYKDESNDFIKNIGLSPSQKKILNIDTREFTDTINKSIGEVRELLIGRDEDVIEFYNIVIDLIIKSRSYTDAYKIEVINRKLRTIDKLPSNVQERLEYECGIINGIDASESIYDYIEIIPSEAKTCMADFNKELKFAIGLKTTDIDNNPVISVIDTINSGFYSLKKQQTDLTRILAHELIHVFHLATDSEVFNIDRETYEDNYWFINNEKMWTDAQYRSIWQDAEEQRTVIGIQDREEISELSMFGEKNDHGDFVFRYPYISESINQEKESIINEIKKVIYN